MLRFRFGLALRSSMNDFEPVVPDVAPKTHAVPIVSVIMPVYNCIETVGRALDSLLAQSFFNIEIIVVDDGSSDGTSELVAARALADERIRLLRLAENSGVGRARHVAVDAAIGDWITVQDADDWCDPDRIEKLLQAARDHQADVVLDNLQIYDHALLRTVETTSFGGKQGVSRLTAETFFQQDNPLCRYPMGYARPMMRTEFLRTRGINYCAARLGEDFMLVAELLLQGAKAVIVPEAYYTYVHHYSPTTRAESPAARSSSNIDYLIDGCVTLINIYGNTMTPRARRALHRRKRLFEAYISRKSLKSAVRHGRLDKVARIILDQPLILAVSANLIHGKFRRKLLARRHYRVTTDSGKTSSRHDLENRHDTRRFGQAPYPSQDFPEARNANPGASRSEALPD
jgi:succinoglycan biosynthesis protein ExoO